MDVYHMYTYGCAFWYGLRGMTRIYDPNMVVSWFQPPTQIVPANDLEIYETKSEAYCLLFLTGLLLLISGAMPLRTPLFSMAASEPDAGARKYAKGIIMLTIFHHITTGFLAASHWWYPTHNNAAMQVGVYGSGGLCALAVWTLMFGMDERNASAGNVNLGSKKGR